MSSGKLTDIDHVGIAVRDLDAAVAWYQQMFGAEVAPSTRSGYSTPCAARGASGWSSSRREPAFSEAVSS